MRLPERIPVGARVVVRITDGVDEYTGRHQYRDYVGHVRAWDGRTLQLTRDAAANGSRPAQDVDISATDIAILKPVPEMSSQQHVRSECSDAARRSGGARR